MKTHIFISLIFLGSIIVPCGCSNTNTSSPLRTISLRQGWFPWAGYAGELVAMKETDSLNGLILKVDPGADDIDPVKMVISGQNDVGITSAEAVILANQKGADLVAIAVINYKSPTCFITLKTSNITNPTDFENHKVGILSGSETETVYRTLVKKLNLSEAKITEVEAPYDLKTFINGAYDVYPGFIYSEPLSLDFQNIQYNLIKPEDYGVKLMGAVYFTTKKMISENPTIIQSFINSLADGWERALKDPEKAIAYLKQYDNTINNDRELRSLKAGLSYFSGENNKVLFASDSSWSVLKTALVNLKKISPDVEVRKSYTNSFINKYHKIP